MILNTKNTAKTNLFLGNAIPVLGVKPKWGWYVICLFFNVGLSNIIRKVSAGALH